MTSLYPYTHVDPHINILSSSTSREASCNSAPALNKAVCEILFSIDDMDNDDYFPVLKECYRVLDQFKSDEIFVALLQMRVVKVVDKLIIPCLEIFVNNEGAPLLATQLNIDRSLFKNPKRYSVASSETVQILCVSCQIIRRMVKMTSNGLKIDSNVLEILLSHLLDCFIISSSQTNGKEKLSDNIPRKCVMNTMLCIIENFVPLEDLLKWFLSCESIFLKHYLARSVLNSMFSYLLANSKQEILLDPCLLSVANDCIKLLASDYSELKELETKLFGVEVNEKNEPSPIVSIHMNANTVMVSPTGKFQMSQNDSRYLKYMSLGKECAPVPPWLEIFNPLSPSTTANLPTEALTPEKTTQCEPRHSYIDGFKRFWHKIHKELREVLFHSSPTTSKVKEHHRYHWIKLANLFTTSRDMQGKKNLIEQNKGIRNQKTRLKRRKLPSLRRKNQVYIVKGSKRYNQRRKPIKYRYQNVIKTAADSSGQKLHYYYKLHKRSTDARNLREYTFERTSLGQIKGQAHRLQLKYQSKIDRLEFLIRGYDKEQ